MSFPVWCNTVCSDVSFVLSRNGKEKQEWRHERDVKIVVQGPAIVSEYFITCRVKRIG